MVYSAKRLKRGGGHHLLTRERDDANDAKEQALLRDRPKPLTKTLFSNAGPLSVSHNGPAGRVLGLR
jgi:hypothetical protein